MNDNQMEADWQAARNGDAKAARNLVELLTTNPDRLGAVVDERAIDAMLSVWAESETGSRDFVHRCITGIQASPVDPGAPAIVQHESLENPKIDVSPALRIPNPGSRRSMERRRTQARRSILSVCLTLLLVVAFGITSGLWNRNPNPVIELDPFKGLLVDIGQRRSRPPAIPGNMESSLAGEIRVEEIQRDSIPAERLVDSPTSRMRLVVPVDKSTDREKATDIVNATTSEPGSDPAAQPANLNLEIPVATFNVEGMQLVQLDGSTWVPQSDDQLGPKVFTIQQGEGRFQFADGMRLSFAAPIEVEIESSESIRLLHGQFLADVPAGTDGARFETPLADIQASGRSEFQLKLDADREMEVFLDRGDIALNRRRLAEGEDPIRLARNRSTQALLTDRRNPEIPSVNLVQGRRHFLAQVVFADQAVTTRQPADMAAMLSSFSENQNRSGDLATINRWQQAAKQWRQLDASTVDANPQLAARMMKDVFPAEPEIAEHLPVPAMGNSNSSFQGSININGQMRQFQSLDEFNRAQQQLPGLGNPQAQGIPLPPQGVPNRLPQGQSNQNFQGSISVNGRQLNFTSPQQFELFRRQMRN